MINPAVSRVWRAVGREDGQAMAEYGVILALVAAVVISTLILFGGQVASLFNTVVGSL